MFETRLCGSTQQQDEGQETQAGAREWDIRKKYCQKWSNIGTGCPEWLSVLGGPKQLIF